MTKQLTIESEKAVKPKVINNKLLPPTTKLSKFDQVAAGTCPHCSGRLGNEVRGSGIGVTRECSQCHHVWYFYKRGDSTGCKCLTCSAEERKRSAGGRKAQSVAAGLDDARVKAYNHNANFKGAHESRWASRTSNPLGGISDVFGGFDSHALPPDSKSSWKKLYSCS
jgi:hypothetical protein